MSENDWFFLAVIVLILRPDLDVIARAVADRIKRRGQK